jgi:glycosyltransferase involved in cell wall biosynthesis
MAVHDFSVETLGVPPGRTRVIPCGIDVAPFARMASASPRERSPVVLVTTGRLVARKGHAVAIQAVAIAARTRPDLELRIVGDGPERSRLETLARASGLGPRARFLGTVWPTMDVLRDADLFLFPSLEEPQGLALLEACAAGVPVIASRTGGIPEMVTDGESARLVPPGDAPALAAAILERVADPAAAAERARRAADRARAFDIGPIADAWLSLYQDMMAPRRSDPRRAAAPEAESGRAGNAGGS